MATLVESADITEPLCGSTLKMSSPSPSNLSYRFDDSRFYLLVVVGEIISEEHLRCAIADIEKGIRSWDTNLMDCNLDQELKLFVSRHSARFSADVRGQKILHHKSNVLETVVLINPSDEAVSTEVRLMISDTARHKQLVLAGQCVERTGELILQSGSFSFFNFIDIFTDQEIGELLSSIHPANKASLTLFCPEQGDWKNSNLDKHNLQDFINMKLNSSLILPEMEGLSEFTEYLSESVEVPSPFDILEPPTSGGFLKLSKPCCYIFPGGHGDAALFAVNGFNMLVNGGSERRSCFWKLVRHLDRVDSILLTHIGDDNLPGINSMLQRKIAELEEEQSQGSTANSEWLKNMISPDIGIVFLNVPQNLEKPEANFRVRRNIDEAAATLHYLSKLSLTPEPLQRGTGNTIEPIILFQKMGVGKLEMYVLNPVKNSKEMQHFMKQWTGIEKDMASILLPNGKESELPNSYFTSISSLIVWHPANPSEKIVRVLFPGNATQNHILEGLEKLKHLDFLKQPMVTQKELNANMAPSLQQAKIKHKTDSKESLKSLSRPASRGIKRESREETPEKAKADTESPEETLQQKEKTPVKKEKPKAQEKEMKSKVEQTPEKKKVDIKPRAAPKEKVMKKEMKKSVEKKTDDKEVKDVVDKKEEKKKDEKVTPKKEERVKKEDKIKKEDVKKEAKKDVKKDLRKESPMKASKKEDKKEVKKDDHKKDVSKPTNFLKRNAASSAEAKKPAPKPKLLKKDDTSKKELGSPMKSKEKGKVKTTKKDTKGSVTKAETAAAAAAAAATATAAAAGVAAGLEVAASAAEALEEERSLMSTPEDLTKDFEVLKAEEIVEDEEALPQTITEEITLAKESPEAGESLDEGITTTEPEAESGETPDEVEPKEKASSFTSEKFEDEGTGLEESSEAGDYEEKGDIDAVKEEEEQRRELKSELKIKEKEESEEEREDEATTVVQAETSKPTLFASTSPKVCSPISPAASIHDEYLPEGSGSEPASDDENRDEPPEEYTTSGHTMSTIEISSVPTPMDGMSTPRDIMSDETTNDETDSPSQDMARFGGAKMSGDFERKQLPTLQDGPEDHSKSEATDGEDYQASASTVSPTSSLEEDKIVDYFKEEEGGRKTPPDSLNKFGIRSSRLASDSSMGPIVRSPSGDKNVNMSFLSSGIASPIELGTTLTGIPFEIGESSLSPDEKTLEGTSSPQSAGHTPYYQSPLDEKAGTLPPEAGDNADGPVIVEVTSDKEDSPKQGSPVDEKVLKSPIDKSASPMCGSPTSGAESPTKSEKAEKVSTFKEESKMSISEGTTSDKSATPVDEGVAEDTFSHAASVSTSLATVSSLRDPTTDDVSPSLHAEVGSPHSTEVDDSLSVSIVQPPTTFQETEFSPLKEDSPRPMSISPDTSPKTAKSNMSLQEPSTMQVPQDSPDHSMASDFSKQSPQHPSAPGARGVTENGPTEVDCSPSDMYDHSSVGDHRAEKPMLFRECDSPCAPSATPSEASQSSPSVTTPCQIEGLRDMSPSAAASSGPATPKASSLTHSPVSPDSLVLGDKSSDGTNKESLFLAGGDTNPFKCESKSPVSPKAPSPSYLPLSSNFSESHTSPTSGASNFESKDPDSAMKSPCRPSRTDVDLCLVKSCEYKHPKTELSPSFINPNPLEYFMNEENLNPLEEEKPLTKSSGGPPPPGGKHHGKQCEETPPTSVSDSAPSQTDSDVPPGTEECPSITADANIDSEDDSETLPTDRTLTYRHVDPPPVAARDAAPSPPHPDVCMVDPDALATEESNQVKEKEGEEKPKKKKTMAKKSASPARKSGISKTSAVKETKTASPKKSASAKGGEGKDVKNATNTSASRGVKSAGSSKTSSGSAVPNCPPMYMDLVYIPNHCSAKNVDSEFFKRVRSAYYVVSGNDQAAQEPSRAVLDALLEGKSQWGNNMQVTLIPTHDSEVMREWYQDTHEKQQNLNIMVLASSSTVVMQDESFPACKIEL
ncbi:microtubule-associated protein 1B [Alosa pseudoharengus]|uniref:microtubule-associated protein 1B n=1 Tax=Alosa pseudoharengus TaxID=34774 RepID=UPI003F888EBC